jgi:protein involved in polysaccharide export with SLBB domain
MAEPAATPRRRRSFLDRKRDAVMVMVVVFGGGLLVGAVVAKLRPPPGLGQQPPSSMPAYSTTNPLALRPGDQIELTLADPSRPDSERVKNLALDAEGGMPLPLIGTVRASGLTPEQLEQAIAQTYRDRNLISNVIVKVVRKTAVPAAAPTTGPASRP